MPSLDDLLPQTQCGLCGHDGCAPYARAIVDDNERIDRCAPGGTRVTQAIAEHLGRRATTEELKHAAAHPKTDTLLTIDETQCIGCTKCIKACPVDAIIGAAKHMHTILKDECTGCQLCLPACPVDCINITSSPIAYQPDRARKRYLAKTQREEQKLKPKRKNPLHEISNRSSLQAKQDYIKQLQHNKEPKAFYDGSQ